MNFSENWYTSSHWHKNNTGKVSWTSEVWFKRYERVLNERTTDNASLLSHSHRRKLFVGDKKYRQRMTDRKGARKANKRHKRDTWTNRRKVWGVGKANRAGRRKAKSRFSSTKRRPAKVVRNQFHLRQGKSHKPWPPLKPRKLRHRGPDLWHWRRQTFSSIVAPKTHGTTSGRVVVLLLRAVRAWLHEGACHQ